MSLINITEQDIENYALMSVLNEQKIDLCKIFNPLSHIGEDYKSIDAYFKDAMENDVKLARMVNSYLIEKRKAFEKNNQQNLQY